MAPKRHKKQKAKQLRHSQPAKRSRHDPEDSAQVDQPTVLTPSDAKLEPSVSASGRALQLDGNSTPPTDPASARVDPPLQARAEADDATTTQAGAPVPPSASAATNGDGGAVARPAEHSPALDVWPDFDELEWSIGTADQQDLEPDGVSDRAASERRRSTPTRGLTSPDGQAADQGWLLTAPAIDQRAYRSELFDDLDEDELEGLRRERDAQIAGRLAAPVPDVVDEPVEDPWDRFLAPEAPDWQSAQPRRRPLLRGRLRVPQEVAPLRRGEVIGMLASLAVALVLWFVAMRQVRLENMSDLGLITALPGVTVVAFALLFASFGYCLWRASHKTGLLALHTVTLVVMLYAIRLIYDDVPAFKVTFRHIGVADKIGRDGAIDSTIDAYFNWPGFFTYVQGLAESAGFGDIEPFAHLSPMIFNLMYLAPLLVIMRVVTSDTRVVWVGLWTFFLTNWVAQDYLSPQGLVFFLFLSVLAALLRWFTKPRRGSQAVAQGPVLSGVVFILLVMGYMIPTHQLTPFAVMFVLFAMLMINRLSARALPSLITVMAVGWLVLMATSYLVGHEDNITGGFGQLSETVSSNVVDRVSGSPGRQFVNQIRILSSLALMILTLTGAWRMFRARKFDILHALMAASAWTLVALQPYGGEVFFRTWLYSLPFIAIYAAIAIMPWRDGPLGRLAPIVGVLWVSVLAGVFVFTRYGNEQLDTFTRDDLAAVDYMYQVSGADSAGRRELLALGGTDTLPWKARHYEQFQWKWLTKLEEWEPLRTSPTADIRPVVAGARDLMQSYPEGAYLIFTRSQRVDNDLIGYSAPGTLERLEGLISRSSWFEKVYTNSSASIYVLSDAGKRKDRLPRFRPQDGVIGA